MHQVAVATKLCTVVPNICGPSVWNFLHVTLLASRILRQVLHFWKISAPFNYQVMQLDSVATQTNTSLTTPVEL